MAQNAALSRVVRGSIMEGVMYQADDDETPIDDPLNVIFQWIESDDDDAPEDAPQELTTLYPALPDSA